MATGMYRGETTLAPMGIERAIDILAECVKTTDDRVVVRVSCRYDQTKNGERTRGRERTAYSNVFKVLTGRFPNEAELDRIIND